ncbi:hypothetical protein EFW17_22105 [Halostreptopolyspora alba]|uniref:Glycerophosphoryl diester phosphodiesterase membrane domain-containing protein n=1 Tax=Halostreptopolyspora alba TaxID=2487137 RepID=A0A3N0E138_9ACTN|nr:hypothetical protein EFW17_22105 [Nocardiopsaceae bacterium YIM 96095]
MRPLNMSEILNGAFSYIRHNAKAVLGLTFIVIGIASVVTSVGMGGYMGDYGSWVGRLLNDPSAADPDTLPFAPWTLATMYGGLLFSYVGQIVLTGLLAAVVGLAVLGRKLTMKEAVREVRGRMGAVFGVAGLLFLLGLGYTALLAGVLALAFAVGYFLSAFLGVTVAVLGIAVTIVVGAWIWVRTSLAMPVTVLERIGPARSLARSWRLTQRSWWRVFGLLLLGTIIAAVVANLVTTPFSLVGMFVPALSPGAFWVYVVSTASSYLATVLSSALSAPFVIGVTTLIYIDLRMRREGLDLRMQTATRSGEALGADVYLPDTGGDPAHPDARYGDRTLGTSV